MAVRGRHPAITIVDEVSHITEEAWKAIHAMVDAERARLDHDCGEALELTAPGRRHLLIVAVQDGRLGLGHVACRLP